VLLINQQDTYLGDKSLDPIFAELRRRQAVVFSLNTPRWCSRRARFSIPRERSPS
jgi:hypothetical protein